MRPAASNSSSSARSTSSRRRYWWVAALVCVALAQASVIEAVGWNQTSHYAFVRSLAHGTARIDPYQASTGDKARYHGHWYSARAPGLAFFLVPAYEGLRVVGATDHPHDWIGLKHNKQMVWLLGIWGAVLPAFLIMLLVRYVAERLEPGYGTAAAVTLGLATLILPFSTMLFSHVFSAMLAFAAFVLLWRERAGPQRLLLVGAAGALIGYGMTTEYPVLFAGIVLGIYALRFRGRAALWRGAAFVGGVIAGLVPLAAFNKVVYGSFTHIAYADIPKQHKGFFGINVPKPKVYVELLFSSRGLLTLSPVLVMAAVGLWLLYRRGRRAEAVVIAAVSLLYLSYNAGYYLPYGGTVPGPRFLITILPFLAVPLALAFRRFPGPTVALAGASLAGMAIPTLTKPLVSAEGDTGIWMRLAGGGQFQATVATLAGVKDQAVALLPFLIPATTACAVVAATTRLRLPRAQVALGVGALALWAAFAAAGPAAFGIDRAAGYAIVSAGDPKGILLPYGSHPVAGVALVGLVVGLVCLAVAKGVDLFRMREESEPAPSESASRLAVATAAQ